MPLHAVLSDLHHRYEKWLDLNPPLVTGVATKGTSTLPNPLSNLFSASQK